MADVAALALSVDSSQVTQATVALKALPPAASAAERAAEKWGAATKASARDSEDFSRRVQGVLKSLEFERAQLTRNQAEQQRYAALRRANVSAMSAEGQAITASVRALQAQQAALNQTTLSARAAAGAMSGLRSILATMGPLAAILAAVGVAFKAVSEAFSRGSGLDELAEQVGISATALQALQAEALQSGVKLEQLETGIGKFSQRMGEASEGSKEVIESLQRLGVKNLDLQGKLRPTEDLLVEVAKAITDIDDPARRSAAAVDFFGKAGTRLLPMLSQIANGMDDLKKKSADSVISAANAQRLDQFADALSRWWHSLTGALANAMGFVLRLADALFAEIGRGIRSAADQITGFLDSLSVEGARATAMFLEAFKAMPETLGQFFTNAWESARVATAKGINAITQFISDNLPSWLGGGQGGASLDTTPRGAGPVGAGLGARITAAGDAAAAEMQAQIDEANRARQRELNARGRRAASDLQGGGGSTTSTTGGGFSAIKGAGQEAENAAKRYSDLIAQLTLAADAQDNMTAAAARGEVAFQQQEIEVKAAEKALSIFGQVLDKNDPKLRKIVDLMTREAQGKIAQAFSMATNELEDQNVILQKQLDLMGQPPELIAKEIAMLKVKQDVEKAGVAITQEEIDRRTQVVETNERLKAQGEELRRANELWTAPLKSALESIQQTAADAFDSMLENGKLSFESLAQTFTKILRRMAAEFLALATVRPVMSVIVNAIGGQGMAQQFGLSSGGGSLFGGSSGGFNMPSFGGGSMFGSGMFGGGGGLLSPGFLSRPIMGAEAFNAAQMNASLNGTSMPWYSGVTWGQALGVGGGLLSMGMGLNSLLSGGGSTGSTIGGIAGMLGGGLGIAGALMPAALGGMLGPIGMGVGLLGAILPSLLGGESKPTITDQTYAQLRYSSGGWFTNGGAWGPNANSSQSEQSILGLGKNLDAVFALLGGVVDPQKVWGLSAQNRTDSGPDWSSSSLSSFLVSPSGNQQLWRMNDDTMWDTASAQIAWRSITEGAVGVISDNMRKALTQVGQDSGGGMGLEAIAQTIAQVKAFDDAIAGLGKTTTGVEQALAQIDAQFGELYAVAQQFGFAVEQIDTAKLKARLEFATSFADTLQRGINDLTDPKINALADLDKWRDEAIKTNADILKNVTGSLDQINKIEELYGLQRAQILADTNQGIIDAQKQAGEAQIATLQDLIRSLTPGGALANVDPRTQLAGLEATYNATRAQAMGGDAAARDRFASDASAYAQFAKSFYGGSTDYNRIRDRIIGDATGLQVAIGGGWSSTPTAANANDAAMAAVTSQFSQLMATVQSLTEQLRQSEERTARLEGLLQRYVANNNKTQAAA